MEHFPDDILIEIFLRLPVISLLLSKPVCKRWLRIIQNPNFISLHFNRPISHNPLLILRILRHYNDASEKIVLTMRSYFENQYYDKDMPLKLLSPSMASVDCPDCEVRLIGPCNGLFCITDTIDLLILNPATRQFRNVPYNPVEGINYFNDVGFGFDPVENDYKVVRFVMFDNNGVYNHNDDYYDDPDAGNDHYEVPFEVEIYSLSTNSWREVEIGVPPYFTGRFCSYSVFCNGAFHWFNSDNNNDDDDDREISTILVFDLNKEAFKWFDLPDTFTENDFYAIYLSVLDESLTVVVHDVINDLQYYKIQIWSMMEYGDYSSWKKLYNINNVIEVERPLSFSDKKELFVETVDGELASIDLTVGMEAERPLLFDNSEEDEPLALYYLNIGVIENFSFDKVSESVEAFSYRESLVSLN